MTSCGMYQVFRSECFKESGETEARNNSDDSWPDETPPELRMRKLNTDRMAYHSFITFEHMILN